MDFTEGEAEWRSVDTIPCLNLIAPAVRQQIILEGVGLYLERLQDPPGYGDTFVPKVRAEDLMCLHQDVAKDVDSARRWGRIRSLKDVPDVYDRDPEGDAAQLLSGIQRAVPLGCCLTTIRCTWYSASEGQIQIMSTSIADLRT